MDSNNLDLANAAQKPGFIKETVSLFFWAGLIALIFRSFLFESFTIPTTSMVPNLLVGDYLFVNKFSYGYNRHAFPFGLPPIEGTYMNRPVERGDVFVFSRKDHGKDYIKRCIGLPGDRIQFKKGHLHINGEPVGMEPTGEYLYHTESGEIRRMLKFKETLPNGLSYDIIHEPDFQTSPRRSFANDTQEYVVPEGHYMGIGDNRDHSGDSRYLAENPMVMNPIGYISKDIVIGRASLKWFSLENAHFWEFWKWPFAIRFNRLLRPIR